MRIIKTLTLIASLLAPQAAFTTDLTISLEGIVEYDSNVFRNDTDEEDDVLFRLRPGVKIHDDRGEDLRYSLLYEIPFEFAAENGDELDDVDHRVLGNATYHVNERLEFFGSNDFRYLRSGLSNEQLDDAFTGDDTLLLNQNRERVTLNLAEGGAQYRFTPRLTGSVRASHQLFESDRKDRADNWQLSGTLDTSYVLTPQHTVGMGVTYYRQDFDDRSFIVGSTTNSYNAFAQWIFQVDETLSFAIAGGPTYIDVNQNDAAAQAAPQTIPSLPIGAGTNLTPTGLLRADGTPATGPLPTNGIVISQLPACAILESGVQVFAGSICPINGSSPATAGIVVDPITDGQPFFDSVIAPVAVTNPFPQGDDKSSLDFFAQASIAKSWTENLRSALRYQRTQGGASGLGGGTVVRDTVNLSNTWDLTDRWQVAIRGDWSLRQSVAESTSEFLVATDASATVAGFAPGLAPAGADSLVTVRGNATEVDTMRYGVSGRLTHRLLRNTSAWVQVTYNEQTSDGDSLGNPSDFENFLGAIGVRHVFEPVKLW